MTVNFNNASTVDLYKYYNYDNVKPTQATTNSCKLNQLEADKVEITQKTNKYSADDGKISTKDKLINFGKGIISPITNMFKSPKNFIIGAASIAAVSALTIATGGAIAPVLVAAGVVGGGIQLGVSAHKAATAKTDDEAKAAWQGLGAGTTAVIGSVTGAKAAAKGARIANAESMNPFQATWACIKNTPKAISKSFDTFASGKFLANLGIKKQPKVQTEEQKLLPKEEPKTESKSEPKAEEVKQKVETEVHKQVTTEEKPKSEPKAKEVKAEETGSKVEAKEPEVAQEKPKYTKEEIEAEAKARLEQEKEFDRKTEASQEAYKQSFEKNHANKSAKESAEVFEKKLLREECESIYSEMKQTMDKEFKIQDLKQKLDDVTRLVEEYQKNPTTELREQICTMREDGASFETMFSRWNKLMKSHESNNDVLEYVSGKGYDYDSYWNLINKINGKIASISETGNGTATGYGPEGIYRRWYGHGLEGIFG